MTLFGRSPLVWLAALQSVLYVLVQVPAFHVSQTMADAVVVVVSALFVIWEATVARPVVIPTIVGALRTILVALAAFGLSLPDEMVTAIGVATAAILALLVMPNTTPKSDPAPGFNTRS